jgi:integrase
MSERRRGHGEGHIYRRQDGRWEAKFNAVKDGRHVRQSIYGRSRREVAELLVVALRDQSRGLPPTIGGHQRLAAFLERWLMTASSPRCGP